MRSLEVIIAKNSEAAGRAEAHARNDGDTKLVGKILAAHFNEDTDREVVEAYERGYKRGRQEG
jgi:hypothetical protein